jgi:hypothetical protein
MAQVEMRLMGEVDCPRAIGDLAGTCTDSDEVAAHV